MSNSYLTSGGGIIGDCKIIKGEKIAKIYIVLIMMRDPEMIKFENFEIGGHKFFVKFTNRGG